MTLNKFEVFMMSMSDIEAHYKDTQWSLSSSLKVKIRDLMTSHTSFNNRN